MDSNLKEKIERQYESAVAHFISKGGDEAAMRKLREPTATRRDALDFVSELDRLYSDGALADAARNIIIAVLNAGVPNPAGRSHVESDYTFHTERRAAYENARARQ